jgi:hypothetical protein
MCVGMPAVATSTRMTLATGLCLLVHGCEDVNGGAAELSWKLRPASSFLEDKFVGCNPRRLGTGEVIEMRLDWEVIDPPDVRTGSAQWECEDSHGVTGFDLPEGTAFLTVTPLCVDGPAKPASYIAPAAEQRRVIVGDTVSLGAIELVVTVTSCETQLCICCQDCDQSQAVAGEVARQLPQEPP